MDNMPYFRKKHNEANTSIKMSIKQIESLTNKVNYLTALL